MTESIMKYNKIISSLISYIGFAKKARKIYFGADKILESREKGVIIISRDISSNTLNKLQNHTSKTGKQIKMVDIELMQDMVQSQNVKVFQIIDKNLEKAVISCLNLLEDGTLE